MRAILLGSAPTTDLQRDLRAIPIRPGDLRVGVDGGAQKWLKFGWRPHFAVGDWDSLEAGHPPLAKLFSGIPYLSLSRSKDRSDLFYAVRAALELGADELVCLGVTGGRIDHQLAVIFDLAEVASGKYGKIRSLKIVGPFEMVFLTGSMAPWQAKLPKGTLVSVFALGESAEGVTLKGFRYALTDQSLSSSSRGLSNEVKNRTCEVHLRNGCVLVIIARL